MSNYNTNNSNRDNNNIVIKTKIRPVRLHDESKKCESKTSTLAQATAQATNTY